MQRLSLLALFCCCTFFIFAQSDEDEINTIVDQWHRAAAQADEGTFFGLMSKECIYIGTDITEKWQRDELKSWSAKYFERESAWDFEPYDRGVYFNDEKTTAWFDEKLKTWMGPCRASGVLKKKGEQWLLTHYHLSVTVPNEQIKEFIKLIEGTNQDSD